MDQKPIFGDKPAQKLEYSEDYESFRKQMLVEKMMRGEKGLRTSKIPSSSVLTQVKSFLPQIKSANDRLTEKDKLQVEISFDTDVKASDDENNSSSSKPEKFVKMDIAMFEDTASDDDAECSNDNFSLRETCANNSTSEIVSRPAIQLISELPTQDDINDG